MRTFRHYRGNNTSRHSSCSCTATTAPSHGHLGEHRPGRAGIEPKEAPGPMGRSFSQKSKGTAGGGVLLGLLAAQGWHTSCCCTWLTMAMSVLRDGISGWQCWVGVPQGSQRSCSVLKGHVSLPMEQTGRAAGLPGVMLGGVGVQSGSRGVGCCVLVQGSAVGQDSLAQSLHGTAHFGVAVVLGDTACFSPSLSAWSANTQLGSATVLPRMVPRMVLCLLKCLVQCHHRPAWCGAGLVPRPALPAAVLCPVGCLVQCPGQQFPVSAHCSTGAPFFAWSGTQFCAHCSSACNRAPFCA